jgi:protein-S-isoprenylcysteine O-methyltransferase Ste14
MAYPTLRNPVMPALTIPVTILRIDREERLLAQEPEYRAYWTKTRYRLIPSTSLFASVKSRESAQAGI